MAATAFTRPKGCDDLDAATLARHRWIETTLGQVFTSWGYQEVGAPTIEYADLYHPERVGELYSQLLVARLSEPGEFVIEGPQATAVSGVLEPIYDVVLRPELTAPVTRGVVSRILEGEKIAWPLRLWSQGSVFRNQVPQGLERREFHQVGAELMGAHEPWSDFEACALAVAAARRLELPHFELRLGHAALTPQVLMPLGLKGATLAAAAAGLAQYERWRRRTLRPTWPQFAAEALPKLVSSAQALARRADIALPISNSTEPAAVLGLLVAKLSLGFKLDLKLSEAQLEGVWAWARSWSAPDSVAAMERFLPGSPLLAQLAALRTRLDAPVQVTGDARSLGYYTGVTFELHAETHATDTEVGGGGRYDELHRLIHRRALQTHAARTGQQMLPAQLPTGVGLAFGVEKVAAAIRPALTPRKRVLVTGPLGDPVAARLRGLGVVVLQHAGAAEVELVVDSKFEVVVKEGGATKKVAMVELDALAGEWR